MKIGNREIGSGHPVYVICEGGVTNYGELELGLRQVDVAIQSGADCIKFQAWKTEELISRKIAARLQQDIKFNWFDRLKEKEFEFEELSTLFQYARQKGISVFATPHDEVSIQFLNEELKQEVFKIGSGEAHNERFLTMVGRLKKPVIISFGFQTDKEIFKAIETLNRAGASEIIALHCVSLYPTPCQFANLKRMTELQKLLGIPVGISDHSVGWHIPLAAVAMGACIVEKHLSFDKSDPRSFDNPGALLPEEFKSLVSQIRDIEQALVPPSSEVQMGALKQARDWLGQCLVAREDIAEGTVLSEELITCKRPGMGGLPPSSMREVIGMTSRRMIPRDEPILIKDLV